MYESDRHGSGRPLAVLKEQPPCTHGPESWTGVIRAGHTLFGQRLLTVATCPECIPATYAYVRENTGEWPRPFSLYARARPYWAADIVDRVPDSAYL